MRGNDFAAPENLKKIALRRLELRPHIRWFKEQYRIPESDPRFLGLSEEDILIDFIEHGEGRLQDARLREEYIKELAYKEGRACPSCEVIFKKAPDGRVCPLCKKPIRSEIPASVASMLAEMGMTEEEWWQQVEGTGSNPDGDIKAPDTIGRPE